MQIIDNFSSSMNKFLDARQEWESFAALQLNEDEIYMPDGFMAYCKEEGKWYVLKTEEPTDVSTYEWSEVNIGECQTIQYATVPAAIEANEGKIIEYIGDSDDEFTNGYFYKLLKTSLTKYEAFGGHGAPAVADTVYTNGEITENSKLFVKDEDGNLVPFPFEYTISLSEGNITIYYTDSRVGAVGKFYYNTDNEGNIQNDSYVVEIDGTVNLITGTEQCARYIELVESKDFTAAKEYASSFGPGFLIGATIEGNSVVVGGESVMPLKEEPKYDIIDENASWEEGYGKSEESEETLSWEQINVQPSVEGSNLKDELTASISVGGIEAGKKFDKDESIEVLLRKLLCPMTAPEFTFTSLPVAGLKKLGTTVETPKLNVNVTSLGNNTTRSYVINNKTVEVVGTTEIDEIKVYENPVDDITSNKTFTCVVSYSDGDETKEVKKELKFEFVNPSYHGIIESDAEVNEALISGLTEGLSKTPAYKWEGITLKNKKLCYAFPASIGNITKIEDSNNFDVTESFAKFTVEVNGEDYSVYITKTSSTLTNGKMNFIGVSTYVGNDGIVTINADGSANIDLSGVGTVTENDDGSANIDLGNNGTVTENDDGTVNIDLGDGDITIEP